MVFAFGHGLDRGRKPDRGKGKAGARKPSGGCYGLRRVKILSQTQCIVILNLFQDDEGKNVSSLIPATLNQVVPCTPSAPA
jgi:hypothetical protein